jgi:hypothetical protein
MKLARFDLYRYSLPFYRPLTLAGITLFQREGILLKLSGDDWWRWRPASETALFLPGWTPTGRWPKTFSRRRWTCRPLKWTSGRRRTPRAR